MPENQTVLTLGCIVEGEGDHEAVPALVHRIHKRLEVGTTLITKSPYRIPRKKLVKPGVLEAVVNKLANQLPSTRAILILLDADDDCPARLGPELASRAIAARCDVPIGVVLAKREFEAWFLAAASSIAGQCGLDAELPDVPDPESPRDVKGWLSNNMPGWKIYKPRTDQKSFVRIFDIDLARKSSPSFDKCHREITRLLKTASPQTT